MPDAAITLPPAASRLLERHAVELPEALAFLGISNSAGYPAARRYRERIARETRGDLFDPSVLRPKRHPKTGAWREIPCYSIGHKLMVRTDLLVPMVFPEHGWPV